MDLVQVGQFNEEQAREYLETIRWPDGPKCPHCGSLDATRLADGKARPGTIQCNSCRQQFTVTVNTIMEDSHIPLNKWVLAFHLICSSKKGISALQLQRNLGLGSYRTAWFMAHRIRHAFKKNPTGPILSGIVEVDETYIGGKPRPSGRPIEKPKLGPKDRQWAAPARANYGRGTKKAAVMVLVERDGGARCVPVPRVTSRELGKQIEVNVAKDAILITDDFVSYGPIARKREGEHEVIRHTSKEYARTREDGLRVHTNTAESFFALLKRGHYGVFHQLSKKHLHRYCDEFSFRWDHRKVDDGERTVEAIKRAEGKRLMYKEPA
jgi:transposase-like protein